jgi:nitroreductase
MTDRELTAALAGSAASAAAALAAPSIRTALAIGDAQPWRWVVRSDSMDLYADPSRRLATLDPDRHLLWLSCGGSLHHARVALAAEGFGAEVTLLPDDDPDHLATVRAPTRIEVTREAKELYESTGLPHTERQRIADAPPSPESMGDLAAAARAEGVGLLLLSSEEIMELAAATAIKPKVRERIGRERSNAFAVLYGEKTTPAGWLAAGQALSAVWLTAIRLGISVVPSSAVVQLPGSGEVMRRLLATRGTPYLALRLGLLAPRPGS